MFEGRNATNKTEQVAERNDLRHGKKLGELADAGE